MQAFDHLAGVELEYRILQDATGPIARAVHNGTARVMSLHNYYPHPPVLPSEKAGGDAFLLSSPDPEQQRHSVAFTRKSLRWAAELGAGTVVLHLGRVEMDEPMEKLQWLCERGEKGSQACEKLLGDFRKERAARKEVYLETVMRNLGRLLPLADRLGIRLGLENRFFLREIPDVEETDVLLEEFKGGPVGYWHDMGHASVHGNLGVRDPLEWIRMFGGSLLGTHIHDTRGVEDHLAPGEGDTDFSALSACFRPEVVKILEIRPSASPEAIRRGISLVRDLCSRAASTTDEGPPSQNAGSEGCR